MEDSVLLTDLYQLSTLQAYYDLDMNEEAVFEFFVCQLPEQRNFLIAAGLAQLLEYLEGLHFSTDDLAWLSSCGRFHQQFVESLANLHFTGSVEAMPEGTVFFPNEPILRVIAPLREAQLIESRLVNLLQFQTLVATKAARVRLAASDRLLVDFGLRRAHGAEAALLSARASYLGGFDGTATLLAGVRWNIPLFGTMAHSFIETHDDELTAFTHFAQSDHQATTLLIDTYDTDAAARAIIPLARQMAAEGNPIHAVRIDSGDLGEQARQVRGILDTAGLPDIHIFASSNLDEYSIRALVTSGAPIDGYGVGTRVNTAADQPYLDCVYKLQEYAGRHRRQRALAHAGWPGRKQVFRRFAAGAVRTELAEDTLGLINEHRQGIPLLQQVMRHGRLLAPLPDLSESRRYAQSQLAALPPSLRRLEARGLPASLVEISAALQELARELGQPTP